MSSLLTNLTKAKNASLRSARDKSVMALGDFFFGQQTRFTIVQTLILLELALTSSSITVYTLCSGGFLLIVFLTIFLRDDNVRTALVFFYPVQLLLSTTLLSVTTLIKVYVAEEQTDLSLVFLGIAFTSEHAILLKAVIPLVIRHIFHKTFKYGPKSSAAQEDIHNVTDGLGLRAQIWQAFRVPGSCACHCKSSSSVDDFVDKAATVVFYFLSFVGATIAFLHSWASWPLAEFLHKAFSRKEIARVRFRENEVRRKTMEVEITQHMAEVALKSLKIQFAAYLTVLIVDLEFVGIAVAMSVVSGGARVGGSQSSLVSDTSSL